MIEANNLSFSYENNVIFDKASFSLPSKGVYMLRGNNGIGKTTLFELIVGKLKPNEGYINVDNVTIDKDLSPKTNQILKSNILYISQKGDFIDFLNAKENANVEELLLDDDLKNMTLLNDKNFANKNIKQLSSGEKILTSLEKIITSDKKILLLDEITDFLDEKNTNIIIETIKKNGKKKLILVISHDDRILEAFPNVLTIENKKIIQNYSFEKDEFEPTSFAQKNYKIRRIEKRFLVKNFLIILLSFFLFTFFNSITLFSLNIATYPYNQDNLNKLINSGNYQLNKENKDLIIKGSKINSLIMPNGSLTQKEKEAIDNKFNCDLSHNFGIYTSKHLQQNGKILLTEKEFEKANSNGKIINNKFKINLWTFNTYLLIPYEIKSDSYFPSPAISCLMNLYDFKNLVCASGISLNCSLWENKYFDFSTDNASNFFSYESKISFISPEIYKEKYNITLDEEISDNDIYISKHLYKYYQDEPLNFFPFSDYDLKNFDNIIFDLNSVFKGKMLLQRNEIISSILNTNEVLISSSNFKKLSMMIFSSPTPLVTVNEKNKKEFINYISKNNFKLPVSIDSYSSKKVYEYEMFLNSLQEEIWFYEILYIFLFLIEKWIIIFFSSSFLKKNNSNIRILSNYISKNQISLLISFPFLISQISSLIFSICISNLLLLNYTKSQKYSIPLISYNFFGIIFSLIIIFLDILLFYIVMKKSLKSSK